MISDIFIPVAIHLEQRADSLRGVKRFPRTGLVGWFKVEVFAALGNKIQAFQNRGPDLLLESRSEIELRAATDFNPSYLREGSLKYGVPCLFLADGSNHSERRAKLDDDKSELVAYRVFPEGEDEWIVGLIFPILKNG